MKAKARARTAIDEIRENWPQLDSQKMNLICLVHQFPDITMTEAAEAMGLSVHALHCQARGLEGGYNGRQGYGFLTIGIGDEDKRERPMKLTSLGMKAAKLLAPLSVPVSEELIIQPGDNPLNENQMDLLEAS